ncbi:MAG: acyltransferase [Trueperella sp.]|nr:acyltransferase [Trueperella sp.]
MTALKKLISNIFMYFSQWEFRPVAKSLPQKTIVIGAPHSSLWDAVYMVAAIWNIGRDFKFLVKDDLMRTPLALILKPLGGIWVDRTSPHGLVEQIVAASQSSDDFILVLAPEATRSAVEYWRSGFYYMAKEANIPVTLGFIDHRNKTYGWGESIELTGDMTADMDKLREFYEGMTGVNPGTESIPRLRAEDEA